MTTSFVDQNLEYLTDQSLPPDAVLAAAGMSKLQAGYSSAWMAALGAGNLPVLLEAKAGLIRLDLQIRSADDITLNIDGVPILCCAPLNVNKIDKLAAGWAKRLGNRVYLHKRTDHLGQ